jgi:hypothetical protein
MQLSSNALSNSTTVNKQLIQVNSNNVVHSSANLSNSKTIHKTNIVPEFTSDKASSSREPKSRKARALTKWQEEPKEEVLVRNKRIEGVNMDTLLELSRMNHDFYEKQQRDAQEKLRQEQNSKKPKIPGCQTETTQVERKGRMEKITKTKRPCVDQNEECTVEQTTYRHGGSWGLFSTPTKSFVSTYNGKGPCPER